MFVRVYTMKFYPIPIGTLGTKLIDTKIIFVKMILKLANILGIFPVRDSTYPIRGIISSKRFLMMIIHDNY